MKPCRGRQRRLWHKYAGKLFEGLGLDQGEFLDDIKKERCPPSLYLSNVNECVSTRESNEYVEGLNSKVKLDLYIW